MLTPIGAGNIGAKDLNGLISRSSSLGSGMKFLALSISNQPKIPAQVKPLCTIN
jgi:hypothetical protein